MRPLDYILTSGIERNPLTRGRGPAYQTARNSERRAHHLLAALFDADSKRLL